MKAEDFEKATEADFRRKANDCFEMLDHSGSAEKPALLIEAQFYLAEIERREHDRVARRDFWMEVVVIVLIALELYFGITGGNAQLAVLENLNASSRDTAKTMKMLSDSIENQNGRLRSLEESNDKLSQHLDSCIASLRPGPAARKKPGN